MPPARATEQGREAVMSNTIGRRLGAVALAAVLGAGNVLAAAPALAADASVTITAATPAANEGATYNAYRIFTADIDDSNKATNIAWDSEATQTVVLAFLNSSNNGASQTYSAWLAANDHTGADAASVAQNAAAYISEMIGGSTGTDNTAWKDSGTFADGLAAAVLNSDLAAVGQATAGEAFTAAEGYYLFLTDPSTLGDGEVASAPIWFALGGSATTVTEKATPVTLQKEVLEDDTNTWGETADAELGQEVSYRLTVTIPGNYSSFESFYVGLADTLPEGMTLTGSSDVTVTLDGTSIADAFTISASGQSLSVVCNNTKDATSGIADLSAGDTIVVTYKATVNSAITAGATGNTNEATYTYSNDPNSTTTGELTDTAKLYTYFVTIDKSDEVTSEALSGAKFVIQNSAGAYLTATGFNGETQDDAQVFTTDANGMISDIKFLDQGTYTLTEVEAPSGYRITSATTTIVVTPTYTDGALTSLEATVTGDASTLGTVSANTGEVNVDVVNTREVELATTGGVGVGIAGIVVVAAGVVMIVVRNRKANSEE